MTLPIPNERQVQRSTLSERFYSKCTPAENGCWEWTGSSDTKGYGQIRIAGKNVIATHVALELDGRPRPSKEHCALHRCDNPPCVNPAHLWWGSRKENQRDAVQKGRLDMSGLAIGHALSSARKEPLPNVPCQNCGVVFTTSKYRLQTNRRHYCSKACCAEWQSARFTGTARASWST